MQETGETEVPRYLKEKEEEERMMRTEVHIGERGEEGEVLGGKEEV